MAMTSVAQGSTRPAQSKSPVSAAPVENTGSHPSVRANTYIRSSATKKLGSELPTKHMRRTRRSEKRLWRTAQKTPSGTEMTSVTATELAARASVAGRWEAKVAETSLPLT